MRGTGGLTSRSVDNESHHNPLWLDRVGDDMGIQLPELVSLVLGGFLAAGSGVFLQWRQRRGDRENNRKLFLQLIRDDLSTCKNIFDQIQKRWQESKWVMYRDIQQAQMSQSFYYNNNSAILHLEGADNRKAIVKYYSETTLFLNELSIAQRAIEDANNAIDNETRFLMRERNLDQESAYSLAHNINSRVVSLKNFAVEQIPNMIENLRDQRNDLENIIKEMDA